VHIMVLSQKSSRLRCPQKCRLVTHTRATREEMFSNFAPGDLRLENQIEERRITLRTRAPIGAALIREYAGR
jgi:hypothetical protein